MHKHKPFVVIQPGTVLHVEFETYQEAWGFVERRFRDGDGIASIVRNHQ